MTIQKSQVSQGGGVQSIDDDHVPRHFQGRLLAAEGQEVGQCRFLELRLPVKRQQIDHCQVFGGSFQQSRMRRKEMGPAITGIPALAPHVQPALQGESQRQLSFLEVDLLMERPIFKTLADVDGDWTRRQGDLTGAFDDRMIGFAELNVAAHILVHAGGEFG